MSAAPARLRSGDKSCASNAPAGPAIRSGSMRRCTVIVSPEAVLSLRRGGGRMFEIEPADPLELEEARRYCRDALPRVSRTFALNIRILRGDLREAVRLAYLFCRIADTIEDSTALDASRRTRLLEAYRSLFPLREGWRQRSRAWAAEFATLEAEAADLALCAGAYRVFTSFSTLAPALRAPVEECVREMTAGMTSFALRRSAAADGRLRLETLDELELYCHYVAGTVGTMLCRLFAVVSPSLDAGRTAGMQRLAERFGLAMQLTNIIKDVADDADRGVYYVPRALAAR